MLDVSALLHDRDAAEEALRPVVRERLLENPTPRLDDHVVATYFFALRTTTLSKLGGEISYHSTSGTKNPPKNSLLEECTGRLVGVEPFDASERIGLLHMAYPLKMLLQPDGHLTSCDILHTAAGAVVFDVYENQDARLIALEIPENVLETFPGPAHGPAGIRNLTRLPDGQPAFGTILKPTAGITPEEVGELVGQAASCPLFVFIKEDENLYPNLAYSPAKERTRRAVAAIEERRDRSGPGLIFAPHISGAPHEILASVEAVLEAGATGVMFSESFAGGTVRMVREATRDRATPPVIYGHNAGIGVRTGGIWREVIDFLARLDGIDYRQTAPVKPGQPFIRPYGAEWEASENILTCPLPGILPTMIARAGALDQGNIGLNLEDAERRDIADKVLFLSGSAINSIKNAAGVADPKLGAQAMLEAIDVHRSGELLEIPVPEHAPALAALAEKKGLKALREALRQRYPDELA